MKVDKSRRTASRKEILEANMNPSDVIMSLEEATNAVAVFQNETQIKLTKREQLALVALAQITECYGDLCGSSTFAEVAQLSGIPASALKGVIGSLARKEVVSIQMLYDCYNMPVTTIMAFCIPVQKYFGRNRGNANQTAELVEAQEITVKNIKDAVEVSGEQIKQFILEKNTTIEVVEGGKWQDYTVISFKRDRIYTFLSIAVDENGKVFCIQNAKYKRIWTAGDTTNPFKKIKTAMSKYGFLF